MCLEINCVCVCSNASHLVCGRPKFVPTPTRGRLWTTFLTVAASGKLNMTAAVERREISIYYIKDYLNYSLNYIEFTTVILMYVPSNITQRNVYVYPSGLQ